jgi:hypothetical protein
MPGRPISIAKTPPAPAILGWHLGLCLVVALSLAAPLAAQVPIACTVQLDSVGGVGRSVEVAPGVIHQFAGGGVWASCHGRPTRMRADSGAFYSERDRVDFIGHAHFQDSTVTLDAQRASYFTRDERLEAYGGVHLVNLETGSQLDGPTLTYWRPAPGLRDTADMLATDRPTVRYRARGDTTEPYVIVGQQVRLRGDDRTWAGGNVTIERSDFRSQSDSAELDLGAGSGAFLGHAQVQGRGANAYALSGRRVVFRLTDRRLSWVEAQGRGEATSSDWHLRADTIAFDVVQEQIERGTAWGDSLRPDARSVRYTMRADSVALDTPGQRLKELRGFGTAVATAARDSLDGQPDWVAGDSLVARFDTTAAGERILTDLEARGSARVYYRVFEADGSTVAGINYSRGKRLLAAFDDKGVHRVKVLEAGDGVYLEPVKKP